MDYTQACRHHGLASLMEPTTEGGEMRYAKVFTLALTFVEMFAEGRFHR